MEAETDELSSKFEVLQESGEKDTTRIDYYQLEIDNETKLYSSLPVSLNRLPLSSTTDKMADTAEIMGSALSLSAVPTVENTRMASPTADNDSIDCPTKPATRSGISNWRIWLKPEVRERNISSVLVSNEQ